MTEKNLQDILNDFINDCTYPQFFFCDTSYLHDNGSPDDMSHGPVVKHLLDIKEKVLLAGADGPHQLSDVVGVQGAGLCRQTAGQVCVADVGHTLNKTNTQINK